MSVKRLRKDSIKELKNKKSPELLAVENESLRKKVTSLEDELTSTQLALCDVFELLVGGEE